MKDTCEELGCPEDKVQQWGNDVRDWATNDNTSGDNQSLQRSIEQLFLGLCQKKACLYRQTDSNKIRQLRRKRLREEKTKLLAAIHQYNTGQPPETEIQEEEVERRPSAEQQTTDSLIWPWEVQSNESVSILAQKKSSMPTWAKGDFLAIGPNAPQWPDDSVENHDQDSDISDDSEEDPDEDITHTLPPP
ncbi:hypothetical protein KUCAC02_020680 [Chaenocephalus aceratus]|uniref:Uncharacterized protein n=1 Tax=Chaenocephalus aceratus TaxID=36190 RepID=A0ACB9XD65_CHAAC|nr:hypothetical protein KUCAC02_020680 [Chaenocephalus aceratus]